MYLTKAGRYGEDLYEENFNKRENLLVESITRDFGKTVLKNVIGWGTTSSTIDLT
jgi:hypothetical protein